eukprot:TRINITY_DN2481_c0_g4_i6.p1 TRINITY_DN2481_c0_g4~~TRINITY_DN2481_c0_g4_i6.p1  ORF type:complete len:208 (+),score=76.88 TRINITY_DN2481_c0_g4_i6:76-699(+)
MCIRDRYMGNEIEINMWILMNETLNQEYKHKFRTLLYNLQDPKNTELRFALLTGDIKPSELPKLDSIQLAPSRLKRDREIREEKHFKEQILIRDDVLEGKILVKTSKGETIIDTHEKELEHQEVVEEQKSMTEGDEESGWAVDVEETKTPAKESKKVKSRKERGLRPPEYYINKLAQRYKNVLGIDLGEAMAEEITNIGKKVLENRK